MQRAYGEDSRHGLQERRIPCHSNATNPGQSKSTVVSRAAFERLERLQG